MKNLEEKKLLLKMMKAFGQPVDQELIESIRREEELTEKFLGIKRVEPEPVFEETESKSKVLLEVKPQEILKEEPPKPAETNLQPPEEYKVQQVTNYLDTVSKAQKPPLVNALQDNEFQALRKTVLDLLQKVNTLSWGGGGSGAVRIFDQDDFVRESAGNGKFMKWQDGYFVMDEINPFEVVHNTSYVTSNTYVVQDEDYYIGVNTPEYTTIILPPFPHSGRTLVVKDESGFAQLNPIKLDGNIDNDPGGAEIRINNGAVQMIYRDGWRII